MSVITSIPGQLQVIKRTGDIATFDAEKISVAIGKAFLAVEGQQSADSSRIHDRIEQLTEMVTNTFNRRLPSGGTIHVDEIKEVLNLKVNSHFLNFSIKGLLKQQLVALCSAFIKQLDMIYLPIILKTIRNFSLQKQIAISF